MIRRKTGRTKPPSEDDPEIQRRYQRSFATDVTDDVDEIIKGMGGDDRDSLTITSAGYLVEVETTNPFDFVPKRMRVVDRNGPGSVFRSRGTLADKDRIWLKTDADEGTEFTIVFWR